MFKKIRESLASTKKRTEEAIEKTTTTVENSLHKANEFFGVTSENVEFIAAVATVTAGVIIVNGITRTIVDIKKIKLLNTAIDTLNLMKWRKL